jgi:hypothetical protein
MRTFHFLLTSVLTLAAGACAPADRNAIRLGAPLSTAYLYGWDAERGIRLAVEETIETLRWVETRSMSAPARRPGSRRVFAGRGARPP